jgi:hypothetical protein
MQLKSGVVLTSGRPWEIPRVFLFDRYILAKVYPDDRNEQQPTFARRFMVFFIGGCFA